MQSKPFKDLFAIPLRNGLTKPKAVRGAGTKMVNMGELFANPRMTNVTMDRVPLNQAERNSSLLAAGDLLFARQSLVFAGAGKCSIFVNDDEEVCFESHVIRCRLNRNLADPDFYFYLFSSFTGRKLIESIVEQGAGASGIRGSDLAELQVPWVDLAIQIRVAAVLRHLDDKIDLNRRINQTLEAIAQSIFKSWFVDFDPVKAKITAIEQGQDPLRAAMRVISGKTDAELDQMPREHHDQLAATAALFPDAMEDSVLGEIPKGWTPTPIRDVAEVVKGKSYSSKDLVDNDQAALVTLKSFERGGGFRMDGFKPYVGPYKPEQVVLAGDLIVAYTDVTQAAELIGKPAVVVGVDHFKTLVASLDVGIIRPLNKRVSRQFLYGLFMTDAFQSHTFAHTSGTTVLHLSKEGVPSYSFACPDERLVSFFSETAEAMAMEKQRLIDQNRSLATLRDALLPKLLSGELSVADVEIPA
ncbi:restriction endonuclease subunit S [Denitratimonas sp. CY0512]|uniref:restriction endonuclease subunit S n=1 Tax=Denitratimonas sp. CY0512 TaxID=3131940 RepID=UPI0030B355C1